MRLNARNTTVDIGLTWGDWWPMWHAEDDYFSIGFGPLFIQVFVKGTQP